MRRVTVFIACRPSLRAHPTSAARTGAELQHDVNVRSGGHRVSHACTRAARRRVEAHKEALQAETHATRESSRHPRAPTAWNAPRARPDAGQKSERVACGSRTRWSSAGALESSSTITERAHRRGCPASGRAAISYLAYPLHLLPWVRTTGGKRSAFAALLLTLPTCLDYYGRQRSTRGRHGGLLCRQCATP